MQNIQIPQQIKITFIILIKQKSSVIGKDWEHSFIEPTSRQRQCT
jgi:hypothetical protein